MTPAINTAKRARVHYQVHEYDHDPRAESYGEEAAQALGQDPARVYKTLLADIDARTSVVAIVPVRCKLDLKALAGAAGGKKATMTDPAQAERLTGYVVGGISPLGQKRSLRTYLDSSSEGFDTIYVSAGRRGLEIELKPADLLALSGGAMAAIARA